MDVLRILLILTCLLGFAATPLSYAANANSRNDSANFKIGVVLIAPTEMKSEEFITTVDDDLNRSGDYKVFIVGDDMQNKYQKYWLTRGELEEGRLSKEVVSEFVDFSGLKQCLYVVVEPQVDKSKLSNNRERTRASVEVKVFLADKNGILNIFSVIKTDDSKYSDLRAKKGAFEQCMNELGRQINEYLINE